MVKLKDGRYLKTDIGFSTIVCKKDTAVVFKNTVKDWLTSDLTLLHNLRVIIGINEDVCVKCSFRSKNNALCLTNNQVSIIKIGLFMAGDIKWMCMFLGMEGMALHWCIYSQLNTKEWNHCDHKKGGACTIDYINNIIETNQINQMTKRHPKYRGVKVTPFWPFTSILHDC